MPSYYRMLFGRHNPAVPHRRASTLRRALAIGLVAWALPAHQAAAEENWLPKGLEEELDRFVPRAMKGWQVPGLALAIVDAAGKVRLMTYGVSDVERKRGVRERTTFAIGSIAKSFTVVAISMLAEGGKIDWDRPVTEYLPEFAVHDDRAIRRITLRDLVSHRTGMPRHDALWYLNIFPREQLVRRLRYFDPVAPLRRKFGYNNLMVVAAGVAAERRAELSWEDLIQRRILGPLHMGGTRLTVTGFRDTVDPAKPYFRSADEKRIPVELRDTRAIAPAASVYSNIRDMVKWLRFHIDMGQAGSRRLLDRHAFREMRRPHIAIQGTSRYESVGRSAYGMGFYVTTYRGRAVVRHPGVIDGYAALMSFLPGHRAGIVVLTNLSGRNPVPTIIERYFYDRLFKLKPLPWTERFKQEDAERRDALARKEAAHERLLASARRHPDPTIHTGIYLHPAYGRIEVSVSPEGDGLAGRLYGVEFRMRYLGGNEWVVPETAWPVRAGLRVRFVQNSGGIVERLETPLADGPTYRLKAGDLVFWRVD